MKKIVFVICALLFGFSSSAQVVNLSYKTEASNCYVKRIYKKNGNTYIDVDFIALKWFTNEHVLDDYKIINNNPKIRTYRVKKTCFKTCDLSQTECISDFKREIKKDWKTMFSIRAVNGLVTSLYRPICAG